MERYTTINLTESVNISHELTQMSTNENKQDKRYTMRVFVVAQSNEAGYRMEVKTFMNRASCIMNHGKRMRKVLEKTRGKFKPTL